LRYSTFTTVRGADAIAMDKPKLKEKLSKNLMHSLISKAYSDQNCYLRCQVTTENSTTYHDKALQKSLHSNHGTDVPENTNVICKSGCYDRIGSKFERLYGFEGSEDRNGGPATGKWGLSEQRINKASWNAYINRKPESYLPGRIDLSPYQPNVKDGSAILAVCLIKPKINEIREVSTLPSNCGNNFGIETAMASDAGYWTVSGKESERTALMHAFADHKWKSRKNAAAFLTTMCDLYYKTIIPPGAGSNMEKKNRSKYKENYEMCLDVWAFYEKNKHKSDEEIDSGICHIW
jgi:hypothetical protein